MLLKSKSSKRSKLSVVLMPRQMFRSTCLFGSNLGVTYSFVNYQYKYNPIVTRLTILNGTKSHYYLYQSI